VLQTATIASLFTDSVEEEEKFINHNNAICTIG